jgi:hypothetical protein
MNIIDADKEYYASRKTEDKKRGHVQDTKPKPDTKPSGGSDTKSDTKPKGNEMNGDQVHNVTQVPEKCSVCSKGIMGPADKDHPERTYHSKCQDCFNPRAKPRFKTKPKPVNQVISEDACRKKGLETVSIKVITRKNANVSW